ncbi:MAG: hypothetical protein SGPRY_013432, partial [Prymnesium sp.]
NEKWKRRGSQFGLVQEGLEGSFAELPNKCGGGCDLYSMLSPMHKRRLQSGVI